MTTAANDDKKGEALNKQRFKMLEDIAKELSSDIVFPTYFDVVLRLRNALRDPDVSNDRIVALISAEPLTCARLIHQANSAAYRRKSEVRDISSAVYRLGLNAVRNAALTVAMNQLVRSKELVLFNELSRVLWKHSLYTAAASAVISRELSRLNPEEALFAGLIHDLGAFYTLYRAAQYAELRERPESVSFLISQWHESIGESLLFALKLPDAIIEAVRFHDQPRPPLLENPRNMSDVIYAANVLARVDFDWLEEDPTERIVGEQYHALTPLIEAQYTELKAEHAG
jgi:HD-like signal output (HDOD) protein